MVMPIQCTGDVIRIGQGGEVKEAVIGRAQSAAAGPTHTFTTQNLKKRGRTVWYFFARVGPEIVP